MGYYIDLKKISIPDFRDKLENAYLIPSRAVLKEGIVEKFKSIEESGISSVQELLDVLHPKNKIAVFAEQCGLSEAYLTILSREIRSYRQRSNRLQDFPGLSPETVNKLAEMGIKHTLKLYPFIVTEKQRKELAKKLSIEESEVLKLAKLTDLSRIMWVNHTFAFVLYEAGYDTAEKVANADYEKLYQEIIALNQERQLYKGHIGVKDMKICVDAAKELDLEVEY